MAINLQDIEASGKRWEAASTDYPQGKFINGSGSGKRDGSYCHASWANDIFGFLGAILHNANVTPNGIVETARNSQIYTAMISIFDGMIGKIGVRYDKSQGLSTGEQSVARGNISAASSSDLSTLNSTVTALSGTVATKLSTADFEQMLRELIIENGGTVPD